MRRASVATAIFALAAATATPCAAAPQLVFKVDRVTAAIVRGHLVVRADGAVSSGGWTLPRLHLKDAHTETIEFLATPPAPGTVVIQALVPVSTTAVFPRPRYATVQVMVTAKSNAITVPIAPESALPPRSPYP